MCLKIRFYSISSTPENVYLDKKNFDLRWIRSWDIDTYSDLVGHFVGWQPLESVKCLLFCWIHVFTNTLFFISTPENVYLNKQYFDFRWIRSWDIDTRRMWTLSATEVEHFFCLLKIFCFVTSGLQNIYLDIDVQTICGPEASIKVIDTYHIFGQTFCKIAANKVIKIWLKCLKILTLLYILAAIL